MEMKRIYYTLKLKRLIVGHVHILFPLMVKYATALLFSRKSTALSQLGFLINLSVLKVNIVRRPAAEHLTFATLYPHLNELGNLLQYFHNLLPGGSTNSRLVSLLVACASSHILLVSTVVTLLHVC